MALTENYLIKPSGVPAAGKQLMVNAGPTITVINGASPSASKFTSEKAVVDYITAITPSAAQIKIIYESNPDTNAFTDNEKANLANQSGINSGDVWTEDTEGVAEFDGSAVLSQNLLVGPIQGTFTPISYSMGVFGNTDDCAISILAGNTSSSTLFFGDTDESTISSIKYDHSTDAMSFNTRYLSNALKFDSNGNSTFLGYMTVNGSEGYGFRMNGGGASVFSPIPGIFYNSTAGWYFQVPNNGKEHFGIKLATTSSGRRFKVTDDAFNCLFKVQGDGNTSIGIGDTASTYRSHIKGPATDIQKIESTATTSNLIFADINTTVTPKIGSFGNNLILTGKVGIGTINPAADLSIESIDTDCYATFKVPGSIGFGFSVGINSVTNSEIWNYDAGYLRFATNNTEYMRILSNGNVGIGTTNANTKLHAKGASADVIKAESTATSSNLIFADINTTVSPKIGSVGNTLALTGDVLISENNNNAGMNTLLQNTSAAGNVGIRYNLLNVGKQSYSTGIRNSDRYFVIADGANLITNPRIVISPAGNVGVGAIPTTKLHAKGTVADVVKVESTATSSNLIFADINTTVSPKIGSVGNDIVFTNGNVGIGGTPDAKLDIYGSYSAEGAYTGIKSYFSRTNSTSPYYALSAFIKNNIVFSGNQLLSNLIGNYTSVNNTNTAASNIRSVVGQVGFSGTGASNSAICLATEFTGGSTGIISNVKLLNVGNFLNSTSTLTNTYGIYIDNLSAGTQTNAPYAIYSVDTNADVYIAGNVGIGTDSPANRLHAKGTVADVVKVESTAAASNLIFADINTTVAPKIGSVGNALALTGNVLIGTTSDSGEILQVYKASSALGAFDGEEHVFSRTNTISDDTSAQYFIDNLFTLSGTYSLGNAIGTHNQVVINNSSTGNNVKAMIGRINLTSAGAGNTLSCFGTHFEGNSTGTITDVKLVNIDAFSNSTSTITNTYGVYIGDLSSGTQTNAPYAIYSADTNARAYIAGNVGIGAAPNSTKLNVAGATTINNTNAVNSADYTILDTDNYSDIDFTTGAVDRVCTLPTLAANIGRIIWISKVDAGAGKVTVTCEGADTFLDGSTTSMDLLNIGETIAIKGSTNGWKLF
jgi:hypothetical protein